jgi:catechol 2,3-dioxygenase-like lactoylglutathione lyase family enzyme
MFSHVMVGVNDMEASQKFYDAVLGSLGYQKGVMDPKGRCVYLSDNAIFLLTKPINGQPASCGNGSTIGFSAESPELVNAWHEKGVQNGGSPCEEPPGLREDSGYYLAYLRDPSGNKICALHYSI